MTVSKTGAAPTLQKPELPELPEMAAGHRPQQNRMLAGLPAEAMARLASHLELVELRQGDVLHQPGSPLSHAYFPTTAMVSKHCVMASGATAEAAGVGNEGMVGVALFLGGETLSSSAVVLIGGHAWRLEAHLLRQEFDRGEWLQRALLRYTQALITQMMQTAACNRLHLLEQQLCRWLLHALDRSVSHELVLTQELVANMLGVRREGVTEAAGKLQQAGLIRYRRGHITVLDRAAMERYACECYGVVKKEMDRLLCS